MPAASIPGPDGFKPFVRGFRPAFPNIRIEITHAVSEGDLGVVRCRVTGTHTGDGLGMAGTHQSVDFTGMTMARVVDGRIQKAGTPTTSRPCLRSWASSLPPLFDEAGLKTRGHI